MILNQTPIRTSKNYGINNIEIKDFDMAKRIDEFDNLTIIGDTSKFKISNEVSKEPLIYGNGKELEKQIYEKGNQNIKIEDTKAGVLNLEFSLDEDNPNLVENIEIMANTKSKTTVVIKYMSDDKNSYYHNGIIRVKAEPNSRTNIVIINMLNNKSQNFLSIENELDESSRVDFCIVDFGGKTSITNYYSNIKGQEAKSNLNTIYLGTENQVFDMNYIAELFGEKTEANIEVQGALKDEAKKNFKGTIDFKKGCKKAKGDENEFCMLLSDKARSKALPMLLCTEEDVEGNHSSAAGKIEEDKMFYIMSRGISRKDAMKLVVKAKFNKILETIKDEELKQEILEEIDKRLD